MNCSIVRGSKIFFFYLEIIDAERWTIRLGNCSQFKAAFLIIWGFIGAYFLSFLFIWKQCRPSSPLHHTVSEWRGSKPRNSWTPSSVLTFPGLETHQLTKNAQLCLYCLFCWGKRTYMSHCWGACTTLSYSACCFTASRCGTSAAPKQTGRGVRE